MSNYKVITVKMSDEYIESTKPVWLKAMGCTDGLSGIRKNLIGREVLRAIEDNASEVTFEVNEGRSEVTID